MFQSENEAEPDVGRDGRIDDHEGDADDVTLDHRIDLGADVRDERALLRRDQPDGSPCQLWSSSQEIEQDHERQKRAEHEPKAIGGQRDDFRSLRGPAADAFDGLPGEL